MPEQYYNEAQKLALKEYKAAVSKDENPYLPALDDFITIDCTAGTNLGLIQIPAEFIIGTKTRGRTEAFARNFMPLLDDHSEFGVKWQRLCNAHMEEGIRDPIKVYEYLNRYYVEEGNKRVSVLKFFDAVTIPAQVTRILPEQTEENEWYFEYLEFYKLSKVNFVEFTKPGCYEILQTMVGKAPNEVWNEEERNRFTSAFYYFRHAYEDMGGKNLKSSVGDALLAYMRIYGYQSLLHSNYAEIKKTIESVWEELKLQQEESPIELLHTPAEEKKQGLLSKVLTGTPKVLQVAFLHDKNPEVSGWTFGHELGREHAERVLEGKIHTTAYLNTMMDNDPQSVIEQAIEDGNTVLFTTSPRLLPASLRAAVAHPEVTIFNCSLNKSHRYIRTYYARMFEAKFIIGAIAGALTHSNKIGYVCDYPIFGQIAGINAFALGAQMVNPRVQVHLEWSSMGGIAAATKRLTDQGIHLVSSQDMARLGEGGRSSFGLSRVTEEGQILLATPRWNWGTYYEEILRRILDRSLQEEYAKNSKAMNYYWGISAGVVDLYCANALPESVRKLANYLRNSFMRNECNPFVAPIHMQNGACIEHDLNLEQIVRMDYLVENVIGSIPAYEDLDPIGRSTVELMGVEPAVRHGSESTRPQS